MGTTAAKLTSIAIVISPYLPPWLFFFIIHTSVSYSGTLSAFSYGPPSPSISCVFLPLFFPVGVHWLCTFRTSSPYLPGHTYPYTLPGHTYTLIPFHNTLTLPSPYIATLGHTYPTLTLLPFQGTLPYPQPIPFPTLTLYPSRTHLYPTLTLPFLNTLTL